MANSSGRRFLLGFAAVLLLLGTLVFSGCSDSDTGTDPVEDTEDPTVHLVATSNLLLSEGINTYAADASDNEGVTLVEFYDGSILLGNDDSAPFQLAVS